MCLTCGRLATPDQFKTNILDDLFRKQPAQCFWLVDVMDFRAFLNPHLTALKYHTEPLGLKIAWSGHGAQRYVGLETVSASYTREEWVGVQVGPGRYVPHRLFNDRGPPPRGTGARTRISLLMQRLQEQGLRWSAPASASRRTSSMTWESSPTRNF